MSDTISYSFSAGAAGGAGLSASGTVVAAATTLATATLDASMVVQQALNMQIADPTKVSFLAIDATIRDGSVEVQGTGATATPLIAPMVLFGAAVGLFTTDLSSLLVQNKHATESAELTIMIGRTLDT